VAMAKDGDTFPPESGGEPDSDVQIGRLRQQSQGRQRAACPGPKNCASFIEQGAEKSNVARVMSCDRLRHVPDPTHLGRHSANSSNAASSSAKSSSVTCQGLLMIALLPTGFLLRLRRMTTLLTTIASTGAGCANRLPRRRRATSSGKHLNRYAENTSLRAPHLSAHPSRVIQDGSAGSRTAKEIDIDRTIKHAWRA